MNKLCFLLTSSLALTACTAVQRGEQFDYPVEQSSFLSETTVAPGQTVFVSYPYPRASIEKDNEFDAQFDRISFDTSGVRGSDNKVPSVYVDAPWYTLKSVEAPVGVSVSLIRANIGRVVTQTRVNGSSVNVKYREEFKLVYKVSVAPDFKEPVAAKQTTADSMPVPLAAGKAAASGTSTYTSPACQVRRGSRCPEKQHCQTDL